MQTETAVKPRRGPKAYPVRQPEQIGSGLMTVKEAAAHLCISTERLYLMCNQGQIPNYKIGASRRFKLVELDAWIQAQQQAA
ncbi:MAG: helix-turn-helix domain-containing protein [Geobacter sp.]|nr:helix-turn-helix domain-containing protein [Geobacter sp.]